MHAALIPGPCEHRDASDAPIKSDRPLCAYIAGGLTPEGYFDNSLYRLTIPAVLDPTLVIDGKADNATAREGEEDQPAKSPLHTELSRRDVILFAFFAMACVVCAACVCCMCTSDAAIWGKLDPPTKRLLTLLIGVCMLCVVVASYVTVAFVRLSQDVQLTRTQPLQCNLETTFVTRLWNVLGLNEASERWSQIETLLRLAAKESQFGGLGDYSRRGYDSLGSRGLDRDYGYGGYGGIGPYGSPYADREKEEADLLLNGGVETGSSAALERELAALPTTQGFSCRSPRCDRNTSACSRTAERSLRTPYGCCSDYMLLMLKDITEWLDQQHIPYFITYGTLLGAVRENDIIPYTQDMDIVVDRAYWPQLQRGIEALENFGGRRYLFGVDQWEARVARVCADWEGFAATTLGGDSDRFTRSAEFHLDVYASDWWQIADLHLMDCIEPLGTRIESIRGVNFSAPARPRACLEKLYGAEWRTPKRGASGVN